MTKPELTAALVAMRDLAAVARAYFIELIKQGFTDEQALRLTISFVEVTIRPQEQKDPVPLSRLGNLNFM